MKTITLFVFAVLVSLCSVSIAQWQPDVRLTNNSAESYTSMNDAWCIAASGSVVHVVWIDDRDGNEEIYYKRSTDGGVTWGTDTRLTNNTASSWFPSVTVSGSVVHVVWYEDRDGNPEIYYKRSADGGISWGADTRLTNNNSISHLPSVAVSGSVVHVVWYDYRDGNPEIYYKRSADGGISWGADARLTNNPAPSQYPSVAVSGSVVHVVWFDFRDGNSTEIYYKRSTDGGASWGADTRLTNDTSNSDLPSISVSGSVVHVVWEDNRDDGNYEIYYKRSTDGGITWGTDTRLTDYNVYSHTPSVTVSGPDVHVVWGDLHNGDWEIYYKRSPDGGVSWGTDTRLTNNSALSGYPSVSVSGTVVHVVWTDSRDGNSEIYYKRDPTGNPIGIINVNTEIPGTFKLEQNYPNPFNPATKIRFDMPNSGNVNISVYDMLGREIETLVNQQLQSGTYEVDWDASDYSSGVYFYKISMGYFNETKKMILVK